MKNLILLIHGLGGSAAGTWGRFPELVRQDSDLKSSWHIELFSFPTRILGLPFLSQSPRLQLLSDGLRAEIENRYRHFDRIILVAHSLGGLVARRYLVDELKTRGLLNIKYLILYAVPNDGAGLANVARLINFWNFQLKQLCRNSDVVDDLNRDWQQLKLDSIIDVKVVVGSGDQVVRESSARGHWGIDRVSVVLGANHRDIVKPSTNDDLRFLILKNAVMGWARVGIEIDQPKTQPQKVDVEPASPSPANRHVELSKPFEIEIHIDANGNIVGGMDDLITGVEEYMHVSSSQKKFKVILDDVAAAKEELLGIDHADKSPSGRKRRLEIEKRISRARFGDRPLEEVLQEAMEILTRWFWFNKNVAVFEPAHVAEMIERTLNMFLKFDEGGAIRFDVYPEDGSWSKAFTVPDDAAATLSQREGVAIQNLTGIWGLKVFDLDQATTRQHVIPAIVWEYLRRKSSDATNLPSEEVTFKDWNNLNIGLH